MIITITTILNRVIIIMVTKICLRDENVSTKITKITTTKTAITIIQGLIADQLIFSVEITDSMQIHRIQYSKKLEEHVMELADDSIIDLGEIFM